MIIEVVDLWASSVSPSYSGDSMQTIWSSTKNLTALAMAMMVDRGLLAYSDRVAKHWPEFGQKDKHLITLADVLRHEGGLPFFSKQMDIEDSWPEHIKDNGVGQIIEGEEPCFPTGSSRYVDNVVYRLGSFCARKSSLSSSSWCDPSMAHITGISK